jgi:hypothetical protein
MAQQPTFVRAGSTEADFNKDKYDCMLGLQQRPLGVSNQEMYEACMGARGWTKQVQGR